MDEIIAGPRRYTVKIDVQGEAVGTIFSVLISQVEMPTLTQNPEGGHRIVFVCNKDQLNDIIPLVNSSCDRLYVGPYNPEVKMQPAVYKPPERLAQVVTPLQRENKVKRPPIRRQVGGTAARDRGTGQVILKAFKDSDRNIMHLPDLSDAVAAAGYNSASASPTLGALVEEGDLVRIGRGAYRVPTPHERDAFVERASPKEVR